MSNQVFDFADTARVIQELPPEEQPIMSMNGWPFAVKPKVPYQRKLKVKLFGIRWYQILTDVTNLVTNGDFSSSTGWSIAGATISGGTLNFTGQPQEAWRALTGGNWSTGDKYLLTVIVNARSPATGGLQAQLGNLGNVSLVGSLPLVVGNNTQMFTVPSPVTSPIIYINSTSGLASATIESADVRKVTGTGAGGILDTTYDSKFNAGRLLQFYKDHRMWDSFLINHEYLGQIRVRFSKPLVIPEGIPDSGGYIEEFEVELVEHNPSY